jgi:hypothetical protein
MAATNADIITSLQNMRSTMAGKAFAMANRITAPSPLAGKPGRQAMIRNVPAPSEPVVEQPQQEALFDDDATVMIQLAPSPPVVDNQQGGISRDWSVIFEVVRDEYKEKVKRRTIL